MPFALLRMPLAFSSENATQALRSGQAGERFKMFSRRENQDASELRRLLPLTAQTMARRLRAGYNLVMTVVSRSARVKVLFFGKLKEIVGHSEDCVELPDGSPIEALFSHYGATHPELARFRASLVASCNQEFAAWSTPLHSGDEVAFLPPVSGG
jgi:molybdopterin converting factor subunit 1